MRNKGLKLWSRAIKSIPGGNGLLSKRPGRYVPDMWPTYYHSAKGVNIRDLEGNLYGGNTKKNKKWPKNVRINSVRS